MCARAAKSTVAKFVKRKRNGMSDFDQHHKQSKQQQQHQHQKLCIGFVMIINRNWAIYHIGVEGEQKQKQLTHNLVHVHMRSSEKRSNKKNLLPFVYIVCLRKLVQVKLAEIGWVR